MSLIMIMSSGRPVAAGRPVVGAADAAAPLWSGFSKLGPSLEVLATMTGARTAACGLLDHIVLVEDCMERRLDPPGGIMEGKVDEQVDGTKLVLLKAETKLNLAAQPAPSKQNHLHGKEKQ